VAQRTRVLLRAPTGSGKGEVVAGIAVAAPSARILILTPRATLVNDLRDRVERRAGRTVYALGTFPDPDQPCVQIATYSKAAQMASGALGIKPKSRAKPTDGDNDLVVEPGEPTRDWREMTEEERQATIALFNSFDTIICDEAHVVAASSYYRVIRLCNNAYYRIGLSATPTERTDGKNLYIIGAFSDIATLAEFDALIERKDISDYAVEWTKVPPMERPDTIPKSFAAQYHVAIVANEIRNRLILRKAYVAPKPTIVFCERLDHAERLYTQWTEKVTSPAVYVTGEVSKAARESIIADAKSGKVEVIFATKVFAEGIDIPNLASVVNAGGLKAPIPLLQKIGRAMRVTESKDTFVLYDFEDSQPWLKRNWPKIHSAQRKAELAKHHGK
jgi:superfamily II DNA or RNA helicase